MRTRTPPRRTASRRPGAPRHAVPAGSVRAHPSATTGTTLPEWMTEEWKHRVEADARARLKKAIRGVGARR